MRCCSCIARTSREDATWLRSDAGKLAALLSYPQRYMLCITPSALKMPPGFGVGVVEVAT